MGSKAQKRKSIQSTSARNGGAGELSPALLVLAIALFLFTRAYILFSLEPQVSDISMYFEYAAKAIDLHQTPYEKDFVVPYPPLALWTTCVPRLFDDRSITRPRDASQVVPIFIDYKNSFRGLMFFFELVSFILFLLIVWKRRPKLAGWAALFYTIIMAILGHVLYDRLDVGLLMLMMLGAYCWVRSLEDTSQSIYWAVLAYAFVGLGISFKIIPVICVPFLLLSDFYATRPAARLTSALSALALGICIPFIIQFFATGPGVLGIFKFHAEREMQLESLYSTLMMIGSLLGAPIVIEHSHGCWNISGSLAYAMKILSTVLLLGYLAGMGAWAFFRWSRYSRQDAYRFSCYVIPGAVIFSNVLSPQYFVWAFPLLLFGAVEILPAGRALPWILGILLIVVAATTTWCFPYNYFYSESTPHALLVVNSADHLSPSSLGYIVLGLRNFTYLGIVLWLGALLFKHIDQMSNSSKFSGSKV